MITTDVMRPKKRNTHYVNNKDFLDALVEYKKECKEALENGNPRPQIPKYIGECFLKIATHFSYRPNFANYCVDVSTEALTQRGWLKYNKIQLTDKILSYNQETGRLVWSDIREMFVNESYSGKMHYLTNQGLDMFVTPGHRVLTKDRGLIPVEDLTYQDNILLNVDESVPYFECNVSIVEYEGVIWCPTTEYGSFMCRRNGRVFLTGNSYKQDLISDAVENMSRYILNFNPEKTTNPFAYFTQITYYAFLRRIKIEKKESEKKAMIIEKLNFSDVMYDDSDNNDNYSDYNSIKDNVYSRTRY